VKNRGCSVFTLIKLRLVDYRGCSVFTLIKLRLVDYSALKNLSLTSKLTNTHYAVKQKFHSVYIESDQLRMQGKRGIKEKKRVHLESTSAFRINKWQERLFDEEKPPAVHKHAEKLGINSFNDSAAGC